MTALAIALLPDALGQSARGEADAALVRGCQRGEPAAFRRFVELHQHVVIAFVSRLLGSGAPAEDIAQEVFLRAYRAFPSFDASRGVRVSTWLLTIARNAALDEKKRRRLTETPIDDLEVSARAGDPERAREARELGEAIARAAATLSHDHREVFLLADIHGLSMEEIAGVVASPVNTVKQRLFRARERLRELLQPWGGLP